MDKGVYYATLRSTHYWMYNAYIPLVTGSVRITTSNMDMHEKDDPSQGDGLWYERFGAGESSSCDYTISEDIF